MKKYLSRFAFLIAVPFTLLISCNKSEVDKQVLLPRDIAVEEASEFDRNCGCNCPTAVPTATDISYSLSFWYPEVTVEVDIFYRNRGPRGTLRVVLRNASGDIDSVAIVPARHTNAANPGVVHLQYSVDPAGFPYTLAVHGRPENTDCSIRSHRSFEIVNEVSRK